MRYNGKMSFRDFVFPVNPGVIKISHEKRTAQSGTAYGTDMVSDRGSRAMVISGEGEFFGESCFSDFQRLSEVMKKKGGGMLYIPSRRPVFAAPSLLELTGSDRENVITYRFRFVEIPGAENENRARIIYGDGVSCLWDIAAANDMTIDELWSVNPHIKRPDEPLRPWERVKLW